MSTAPDVIVAPATPAGSGALAIVRLTGADAERVADRVFRGRRPLTAAPTHTMRRGVAIDPRFADEPIDEVMAVVFRAPASPTGETVVEFSTHGSPEITAALVAALVAAGARPAQPGEFTRRAFLNGRIDLVEAEAVAEMVEARGRRARRNAMAQLQGGLSARLAAIRHGLLDELAPLEAHIDFGDDVPEAPGRDSLAAGIDAARVAMNRLLDGRDRARLLRHGATIALAGRPNVGKSSLLNALAGEDRALVHAEPGTTRDLVDAAISVGGYAVRLVDTAGIRTTHDPVEAAGVERARRTMAEADFTLLVLEAPGAPDEEDRRIAAELDRERLMVVRNKIDLGDDEAGRRFAEGLAGETATVVPVSARRGDGLDLLVDRLAGRIGHAVGDEDGVTMTSARHLEALGRADDALARAAQALAGGAWADMVAAELRESLAAIGEITGEHAGPELLDRIFSRFCIGK